MSVDQQDKDLIERYLLGKLTDSETRQFNEKVEKDHEFARKQRLISMFPEMMSPQGKKEYDEKMAALVESTAKPVKIHLPTPRNIIWISTALVLAVLVTFLLVNLMRHKDSPAGEIPKSSRSADTIKAVPPLPKEPETKQEQPVITTQVKAREDAIELVRPSDASIFYRSDEIVFQWIQPVDTFTRIYIYSATTDKLILWRGIRPGIRELRVPGKTFYPGSFYWYVGRNDTRQTFTVAP
jgi:hypothetical protein